jgi:peptidoglycan/LPS O-acetylase OafA/YrhL
MRASSGAYFAGLDHLRGLAAFLVFTWHFLHSTNGVPVAFGQQPAVFPLAIFDEGHCGVALFMALSGYLFAKLLDGKEVHYGWFLWNRALRLCPLLFVVLGYRTLRVAMAGGDVAGFARSLLEGLVMPTLPAGAWSITVEAHFYIVLPLILLLFRRSMGWAVAILIAALALRGLIYLETGQVFEPAYLTLAGRIDQFVLGMVFFRYREWFAGKHLLLLIGFLCYSGCYYYVDGLRVFYETACCAEADPIWIVLPTADGLFFAALIAYYDAFSLPAGGISGLLARIGEYSYSIYLLHFFLVFKIAEFANDHLVPITNFYVALAASLAAFLLIVPLAGLSYHLVEKPALRFRRGYIRTRAGLPAIGAVQAVS